MLHPWHAFATHRLEWYTRLSLQFPFKGAAPVQRFCLTLRLYPDPALIAEYIERHRNVWPEVLESLGAAGVTGMHIFERDTQLFMLLETTDDFTFERKAALDNANPVVMQWEREMAKYQQADPATDASQRWELLEPIFTFPARSMT